MSKQDLWVATGRALLDLDFGGEWAALPADMELHTHRQRGHPERH
jgi:hypothetical protein